MCSSSVRAWQWACKTLLRVDPAIGMLFSLEFHVLSAVWPAGLTAMRQDSCNFKLELHPPM